MIFVISYRDFIEDQGFSYEIKLVDYKIILDTA